MDNPIYVPKFKLPSKYCNQIIEELEFRIKTQPSIVWKRQEGLSRKDEATFLDAKYAFEGLDIRRHLGLGDLSNVVNECLDRVLHEYREIFNSLHLSNLTSVQQKIQKTTKSGGYHNWHFEQILFHNSSRVLVWSIYLNDVKEGGETEFLYQSERHKPEQGKIMVFPANFLYTHRGNPPLSGDKYILTGWYNLF
jgi:hypothetical protein